MMLLDSNIIIYSVEPDYDIVRKFMAEHSFFAASIISKVEVLGYHKISLESQQKLENIFQYLQILNISDAVIEEAISLRQKRKMSLGDALIAGTALIHSLAVVTANVSDYDWIDNLEVINPLSAGT